MTMKRLATVAALVAGIAALPLTQATATETIKLTALDGYPIKSMWVKEFADYFIPEVDKRLAQAGVACWLDVRNAREGALFDEIASALRTCKCVLAFVSDQYLANAACMREFHFAADNLKVRRSC